MARKLKVFAAQRPAWHKVYKEVALKRADILAEGIYVDMIQKLPTFYKLATTAGKDTQVQEAILLGLADGAQTVKDPMVRNAVIELRKMLDWEALALRKAGLGVGDMNQYVPILHNAALIRGQQDAWTAAFTEVNDITKLYDFHTRKKGTTPERAADIYGQIYDTMDKGDAARAARMLAAGHTAKATPGMSDLFVRRLNYRVFQPMDGAAYVKYNNAYGSGQTGVFTMMQHHFRNTARDLAVADVLGPRPQTFHSRMRTIAEAKDAGKNSLHLLDGEFGTLMNQWDGQIDSLVANGVQNLQKVMSSSLLGGAGISAISDQAFIAQTRRLFKLTDGGGLLSSFLSKFDGSSEDALRGANMAEFMARNLFKRLDSTIDAPVEGKVGTAMTGLKDVTHKLSGLNWMTNTAGDQMTLITYGSLGHHVLKRTKLAELPDMAPMWNRIGMTEDEWGKITPDMISPEGMLIPSALPDEMYKTAIKLEALNVELRRYATNAPDLTMRAISSGRFAGQRTRGDSINLFMTSAMQFKSFPVMVWRNHFLPAVAKMAEGDITPLMMATVQSTMLGAVALQLREIAKGKEPFAMDESSFWIKAGLQGGFAGMVGDILLKDPTAYQRNLAAELLGPVPATSFNMLDTLAKQTVKIANGEEFDHPAFFRALKPYVPLHSMWWMRAGFERGIMDSLNVALEDDYYSTMARQRNKQMDERGGTGWWAAGMSPNL